MIPRVFLRRAPVVWLFGAIFLGRAAGGQAPDTTPVGDTRASLVARARRADSLHFRAESFQLHARLQDGDFDVGDRITIAYSGIAPGLTGADDLSWCARGRSFPCASRWVISA